MPNRFTPITGNTSQAQILAMINKNFAELDNENVTKVYRGKDGNIAIIEGKLPYPGGFGTMQYDSDSNSRIILGIDPDGNVGLHISKDGYDMVDLFA